MTLSSCRRFAHSPSHALHGTILVFLWLSYQAAYCPAHPISISDARVHVNRQRVSAQIEVFLEDLFLFHNLQPNDSDFLDAETIRRGIELHQGFVAQRFVIQDVEGRTLKPDEPPTVVADMPAQGVPLAELMAHRVRFRFRYTLASPPEFLTFMQRFTDERAVLPSEMQLEVKQESAGVPAKKTLLPQAPFSVRFRWTDPPLPPDASKEESQRWLQRQQEETLGITSYSSVFSFLYIEDYEVRHEILIPLLTLQQSVPIAQDHDDFLDIAEQDAARPKIQAYFTTINPIEVDGRRIEPAVERCDFFGLDFKDFARRADRKPVPLSSARVGLILSYPLSSPPARLQLTWDCFHESLWAVNTVVFAGDTVERKMLSRIAGKNVYRWRSPGRQDAPPLESVPVVLPPRPTLNLPIGALGLLLSAPVWWLRAKRSTGCSRTAWIPAGLLLIAAGLLWHWPVARLQVPLARTPPIPENKVDTIFARVHANIYRAFRFRAESAVYDALATSIDGRLLQDVYLQLQRSLKMQEQGGAVSRIQKIEIVDGQRQAIASDMGQARHPPGFAYQCRWNLTGTVEHWGHVHERINQYAAVFTLEPVDGVWKVTNMELLDQRRLRFETRLREL